MSDRTDMVQRPIAPGASFTYRFALPDAGTFWYHPHADETVQLERGLYDALVVRGPDEPVLDAERVLVLDDVALDRSGQVKPPGGLIERHDGRQGSTRLVNGRREPELEMAAGQMERWRIVNASSADARGAPRLQGELQARPGIRGQQGAASSRGPKPGTVSSGCVRSAGNTTLREARLRGRMR